MNLVSAYILTFIGVCSILGCASAQPIQGSAPITSITGAVVEDVGGRPVNGATVWVQLGGRLVAHAITNSDGRYRIEGDFRVGAPVEVMSATAPGFFAEMHRIQLGCSEIVTRPGESAVCRKEVSFFMQATERVFSASNPQCSFRGRVITSSRIPVAGAQLEIDNGKVGAVTDSAGVFLISAAEAGSRIVTARAIGFFAHQKLLYIACSTDGESASATFQLFEQVVW